MDQNTAPAAAPVRLREVMQNNAAPKRKYPSGAPDKQRERNVKRKAESTLQKCRLDYYCKTADDKTHLMNKIDTIKLHIGQGNINKVTNYALLCQVLDWYIATNLDVGPNAGQDEVPPVGTDVVTPQYQYATQAEAIQEEFFVGSHSSVNHLLKMINDHKEKCDSQLTVKGHEMYGHVLKTAIVCQNDHRLSWTSSQHVEGGQFLVNLKMAHGYFTSGMLFTQYNKFCSESKCGVLTDKSLNKLQNEKSYSTIVKDLATESMDQALDEEMAFSVTDGGDDEEGIGMTSDARHCWRKNAEYSDIVCLGEKTHKVLRVETISTEDDPISQRHEILGVRRIYDYLDNKGCTVVSHAHDNNASVTAYVRDERKPTRNSKDTWHATKGIARDFKKISSGPQMKAHITWHPELSDKAGSFKTHCFWSMKNARGDAKQLQESLLNFVSHHKGEHSQCHHQSRCKTEAAYMPSKCKITDPKAEKLLTDFIKGMSIYKEAHMYAYCNDTHYVESYNNALLQYHDKRICFGKENYLLRTNLAILDWNEHVDRPHTSVREVTDARNPRRKKGLPVHSKKTNNFKQEIWQRWIQKFYG